MYLFGSDDLFTTLGINGVESFEIAYPDEEEGCKLANYIVTLL
jgi:hypothetical protein